MRSLNIVVENLFFWLDFRFGGQKNLYVCMHVYIYIFSSFSADRLYKRSLECLWRVMRHWKRIEMRDKEEKWPTVRLPDLFIQQSPHGSQHCLCLSVNQTGGTSQQSGRLSVSKIRSPHNRLDKLRSWHLEMDKYMLPITTELIFSVGKNNTVVYALQTGVAKNILTSQTQRCSFKSGKTTSRLKKIMMRLQETCVCIWKRQLFIVIKWYCTIRTHSEALVVMWFTLLLCWETLSC